MEILCKLCGIKYMIVVHTFGISHLLKDKPDLLKQRTNDLLEHAKKDAYLPKSYINLKKYVKNY